jgi:hypothetical protein
MKDKIKMILREGVLDNKITRIAIFDFDGTMIDTDTPNSGKPLWKKEFGFEWPFTGWWGRPESLDSRIYFENKTNELTDVLTKKGLKPDEIEEIIQKGLSRNIFDNNPISSTLTAYGEQSERGDTMTILLTGRHTGVAELVKSILDSKSIHFDDYIYKTGNKETDEFKKIILNQLVSKYPDLQEMEIFEDRIDHLPVFQKWANEQKFKVIVHHVTDAKN